MHSENDTYTFEDNEELLNIYHDSTRTASERERACETLLQVNGGLVGSIVEPLTKQATSDQIEDLRAAGTLGLMEAIATWKPGQASLSHWAHPRIRRNVYRTLRIVEGHLVSEHDFEKRGAIMRTVRSQKNADDVEASTDMLEMVADANPNIAKSVISRVLESKTARSMSEPVGDGETTLIDLLAGQSTDGDPADIIIASMELRSQTVILKELLSTLDNRELYVLLRKHTELNENGKEYGFSDIGRELGLSRERVRQIHNRALAKLGHPANLKKLNNWRPVAA